MSLFETLKQKELEFRSYAKDSRHEDAIRILSECIELIVSQPEGISFPQETILIRRARIEFQKYLANKGARNCHLYLIEAAKYSTPTSCKEDRCSLLDPQSCAIYSGSLTDQQRGMCQYKLFYLSNAKKIQGALCAKAFEYEDALNYRRVAVELATVLCQWDGTGRWDAHLYYVKYWHMITLGYTHLLSGSFPEAKACMKGASKLARHLSEKDHFPNYFTNKQEIINYALFMDAIYYIKNNRFCQAKDELDQWLQRNTIERSSLRSSNIEIAKLICDLICKLNTSGEILIDDWKNLDRIFYRENIGRTTWALWDRLIGLYSTYRTLHRRALDTASIKRELSSQITGLSSDWQLFIIDSVLVGEDRSSGALHRRVARPSFIDFLAHIDQEKHRWQDLLIQCVKFILLIVAEYEELRATPRKDFTEISERLTIRNLVGIIRSHFEAKGEKKIDSLDRSLEHLKMMGTNIEQGDFRQARDCLFDFLSDFKAWPHIVYVQKHAKLPRMTSFLEDESGKYTNLTVASRCWDDEPKVIEFEGPQELDEGSYYYLNKAWNYRKIHKRRIRADKVGFLPAKMPEDINHFSMHICDEKRDNVNSFHDWVMQFNEDERLLASKLFSHLIIYDHPQIVEAWQRAVNMLPPVVLQKGVFIGIGHGAKSGKQHAYHFRQALTQTPGYNIAFSGKEPTIFADIGEYVASTRPSGDYVVFLDDFVGSGGQAKEFIEWYFTKPEYSEYLKSKKIYLAIISGLERGVKSVMEKAKIEIDGKLRKIFEDIVVADIITEEKRAFSESNPMWRNKKERRDARRWACNLGKELLQDHPSINSDGTPKYNAIRDKLGWKGSQALVAFSYNIPSNTLPIFWAEGTRNGVRWKPLFKRFD